MSSKLCLMAVCLVLLVASCDSAPSDTRKPARPSESRWKVAGQQTWSIDGESYRIGAMTLIPGTEERPAQLSIEYICNCGAMRMSQKEAARRAWPLMRYAYEHGLHETGRVRKKLGQRGPVGRIGVAVTDVDGERQRGTGVWMSLDEIARNRRP